MSIRIACDFCGKVIEEVELIEAWGLEKFRGRERICCEDCEREWEKYEKDLRSLEQTCAKELDERKRDLKQKYFKLQKDSAGGHGHESSEETGEKEIPPTIFKTLRD